MIICMGNMLTNIITLYHWSSAQSLKSGVLWCSRLAAVLHAWNITNIKLFRLQNLKDKWNSAARTGSSHAKIQKTANNYLIYFWATNLDFRNFSKTSCWNTLFSSIYRQFLLIFPRGWSGSARLNQFNAAESVCTALFQLYNTSYSS